MLLLKPSANILSISPDPLDLIERAGRTCYKSEDKITRDSCIGFAEMILKNGHETVIEHAGMTVRFICDRGVTHEIVRHRLATYSQESTRFCDYNKGDHLAFIIPPWVDIPGGEYDYLQVSPSPEAIPWFTAMQIAERTYKDLREIGWKPEQARSVLPNSLKTEIVMTANFREWRLFFKQRTSPKAHPQMREVAIPLLERVRSLVPIIFENV